MNNINAAQPKDFPAALQLLEQNNLPTEDITESSLLFVSREEDEVVGTIGIEFYKESALLRSLAVSGEKRSKGLGKELVQFLEDFARKKGVKELVLLTTTAAAFFEKNGYTIITRDNVPEELKKSSEFTSTCPASATVMKKNLA